MVYLVINFWNKFNKDTSSSNLARDFGSPIKDNKEQDNFSWQDVVSACPNKDDYKHALVWKFIELVAKEKSLNH